MKSTMKSAFAFIAVAMMIMVAVVPMVSVFTEGSSAASDGGTVVGGKTSQITVSGTVSDSITQKMQNALIEVTHGSYKDYDLTNSDGSYNVTVNYTGDSVDLTVAVVINDGEKYAAMSGLKTANPADGKFTTANNSQAISGATSAVSNINFTSGYVAISGKLTYKNTVEAYDKEVTVVVKTVPATGEDPVEVTSATSNADGTYSVLVPVDKGKVKVYSDGFATSTELNVTKFNLTANMTSEATYKAYITYADETNTLSLVAGAGITLVDSLTKVMTDDIYAGKYSYTYKLNAEGDKKITVSDTYGYGYPMEKTLTQTATNYKFAENACIVGTICMGADSKSVLMAEATESNITIDYYKGTEKQDTSLSGVTTSVLYGLYTISFGKVTDFGEIDKVVITYKIDENTKGSTLTTDIPENTATNPTTVNIAIANTGYWYIDGTISAGVVVAVTSEGAVGLVDGKVIAGLNGKYSFYVKSGANVTITPVSENGAVFTPSSQTITANKDTTVNFTLKTKELTSTAAVTDAADKALSGITVNYVVGLGAVKTVTTGKDGKFKITVNSDVSADDVMVYFADTSEVYTFDAKDSDSAVAMSESSFKANEQTLTFKVTDAAGKAITGADSLQFIFAEYKIHATGEGIVVFEPAGTVSTESNVTYDAETGTFSFIAKKLDASTADYRTQYGIFVKTGIEGYTFAAITEYADNLVLKANEFTLTGFVKDAAGDKAVSSATVTNSSATSVTANTNAKGYFSLLAKVGDVIKVTDVSPYTFDTEGVKITDTKEITIKANEKTFKGTLKDADGKLILGNTFTVKVVKKDGNTQVGTNAVLDGKGAFTIVTDVKEGYILKVSDSASSDARTFADVTLKGTETALDAVSGQATYSGKVYLADGTTAVSEITVKAYKTSSTAADSEVKSVTTAADGSYTMLLPVADDKAYVVKATTSGKIEFSTDGVAFEKYVADIKSTAKISDAGVGTVVALKDQADEALGAGYSVTLYYVTGTGADAVYNVIGKFTTDAKGQFKTLVDKGTTYAFGIVAPKDMPYTFGTDGYVTLEDTAISEITANEETVTGDLKSKNDVAIPGATLSLLDENGEVMTTAKTDDKGEWTVIVDKLEVKKVIASTSAYGAITVDVDVSSSSAPTSLVASVNIYSGLYAKGDVVSGVVVTYEIYSETGEAKSFVEMGKAAVIDNMFYIVTKETVTSSEKMTVVASASDYYAVGTFAGDKTVNLEEAKKAGIVNVDFTDKLFGECYQIYNVQYAQIGDSILLRASNVAYGPLDDDNQTTVVKYVFKGWYVNGEKVSDDLEYVYTVTGECLVYADYEVSSYETTPSPSNGVDSTTLAIGIAAVIIALIAVVYAVIQKKQ